MRSGTLWGAALFCLAPNLTADYRFTATKERLWGMESLLHDAIREHEVPLRLLPSGEPSRFRIFMTPRFGSRSALLLYQKATGRSEDTTLELYDPHRGEVVTSLEFRLDADETVRRRAAQEFVRRIKQELRTP